MPSSPQNRRRGIGRIGGSIIDELNEIGEATGKPGIGTRLARELNQKLVAMNARVEAASGQRGTVKYGPMTRRDSQGRKIASMDLQGGRMVGLTSDPTDGSEPITLEYWRKHQMECRRFAQMHQDCIEEEEEGVTEEGDCCDDIIPWFFGYSIHPVNELDTHTNDMETAGRVYMWPFVLTHPSIVRKVTFGILDHLFSELSPRINVGIADANLQLVLQTGPVDITDPAGPPGQQLGDYYQTDLGQDFELPAGEYYMLFSSNSCIRIWSFSANSTPIFDFLNESKLRFLNCIISTGHLAMPEDFTTETLESLKLYNSVNIPIILYEQGEA